MRNSLNPWKYWKNQVFRTDQTVCSGIRNNSASLYTDYWHELSREAAVCFPDHYLCNNSSEDRFEVPFLHLSYILHPVSHGHIPDVPSQKSDAHSVPWQGTDLLRQIPPEP